MRYDILKLFTNRLLVIVKACNRYVIPISPCVYYTEWVFQQTRNFEDNGLTVQNAVTERYTVYRKFRISIWQCNNILYR